MKLRDYLGYEIHVNDKGLFTARKIFSEGNYEFLYAETKTLEEIEKAIDKIIKLAKSKPKALHLMGNKVYDVTITSIAEGGHYARISYIYEGNKVTNEQVQYRTLYKVTNENKIKLLKLIDILTKMDNLRDEYKEIDQSTEKFTPKDVEELIK